MKPNEIQTRPPQEGKPTTITLTPMKCLPAPRDRSWYPGIDPDFHLGYVGAE